MTTLLNNTIETGWLGRGLRAAVLLTSLAAVAHAQPRPWTTAGSAGTVDEADTADVRFVQNDASLVPGAAVGTTATIRYNVVAVDGAAGGLGALPRLTVRYRTGDATGRVIVRLKRYPFAGGAPATVLEFTSAAHPATGGGYATQEKKDCAAPSLDFNLNAYFVEVEFQKNGAGGSPALGAVKMDLVPACIG